MDLQICLDYFSIITYMTDYVTKPETKTTEALKQVKKIKDQQNASTYDLMQALIHTYLTHREMGECESYYRLDPTLHYKQSNIGTIFLNTGFPGNRSKFLRKCKKKAMRMKEVLRWMTTKESLLKQKLFLTDICYDL